MQTRSFCAVLILMLAAGPSHAAMIFNEVSTPFAGVSHGDVQWADYDSDGDLDVFLTGRISFAGGETTRLYRNDGGDFAPVAFNPLGVDRSEAAWADLDNDGDLDLALLGTRDGTPRFWIFQNQNGVFTSVLSRIGPGDDASIAAGDLDRDGDVDLWIQGETGADFFYNEGNLTFANSATDVGLGDVALADLDQSGLLDRVRLGTGGGGPIFERTEPKNYEGLEIGSRTWSYETLTHSTVALGDFDVDGFVDMVAMGQRSSGLNATHIYRGPDFDAPPLIHGVSNGDLALGDADNDGDQDLVLTGSDSVGPVAEIYEYGGSSFGFSLQLDKVSASSAAWGDYDGDGDLDLLVAGLDPVLVPRTRLYRNDTFLLNGAPSVPDGLGAEMSGSMVRITWNAATDLETGSAGLTYNLRVGTTPGGCEIVSPHALPSGERLEAEPGNAWNVTFKEIPTVGISQARTLYFAVQAIDAGFQSSAFSPEVSFEIPATTLVAESAAEHSGYVDYDDSPGLDRWTSLYPLTFGDWDRDGDVDAMLAWDGALTFLRNDDATFSPVSITGLPGNGGSTVDWGDFDFDGDLDLVLSNGGIYRNDGGNTPVPIAGVPSSDYARWGDYDNDGDLDVLSGDSSNRIYQNQDGVFVNITGELPGNGPGKGCWIDYDGDRDLDALVCGEGSQYPCVLYRNEFGTFVLDAAVTASLPGTDARELWTGDFDGDGDADVLAPYLFTATSTRNGLFRNDGSQFALAPLGLAPTFDTDLYPADIDGDGDLDVTLTGQFPNGMAWPSYAATYWIHSSNTVPTPPTNLQAVATSEELLLVWQPGSDAETPSNQLTYNVRVGTTPQGDDVVPAMSRPSGLRMVTRRGNAASKPFYRVDISAFAGQSLYYSVQTVDGAFVGSSFTPEQVYDPNVTSTPQPSSATMLQAVHPNPMHADTQIDFALATGAHVELQIFDLRGRRVRSLVAGTRTPGAHAVRWDGRDEVGRSVSAGSYVVRLSVDGAVQSRKLAVLR